jgi:hypothetical protein
VWSKLWKVARSGGNVALALETYREDAHYILSEESDASAYDRWARTVAIATEILPISAHDVVDGIDLAHAVKSGDGHVVLEAAANETNLGRAVTSTKSVVDATRDGDLLGVAKEAVNSVGAASSRKGRGHGRGGEKGGKHAGPLQKRAKEVQAEHKNKIAKDHTVTAVGRAKVDGKEEHWVASSEDTLRTEQRTALGEGEKAVKGKGDAEATLVNEERRRKAAGEDVVLEEIGTSSPICSDCEDKMRQAGVKPEPGNPLKGAPSASTLRRQRQQEKDPQLKLPFDEPDQKQ